MDKLLQSAVLLAAVISAVQCLQWKDCGSSKANISMVSVTNCDSTPVCILKQGSSYTISVHFTPSESVTSAKTVVHGVVEGIPVPFPVDNPDACKDCGMTCPVSSGTSVSYHSSIAVKSSYPKIKVVVKWEVKDQNSVDLACITLPAQIEAADKKATGKHVNHLQAEDNDTALRFKPKA